MKKILPLFLILLLFSSLRAQKEQDPDTLIWNNRRYAVAVHPDVPSVVISYFQRLALPSPFQFWSSTNNRGHAATLEIINNDIYLRSIEAKRYKTRTNNIWAATGIDTVVAPAYFNIRPLDSSLVVADAVMADWFSGVLQLSLIPANKKELKSDEAKGRRLLLIDRGHIVYNILFSPDDIKSLSKKPLPDAANDELRLKSQLLSSLQRYNNFFTRCALDRERVSFNGHSGLFDHAAFALPLIMSAFHNDATQWPYAWNASKNLSGAPFGEWILRNDSLFLAAVNIHWGDLTYPYDSLPIPLSSLPAPLAASNGDAPIFAHWVNGEQVIHYGSWQSDDFGVRTYSVAKTQSLLIRDGIVTLSKFSPRSFDDDEQALLASDFLICDPANVFAVSDRQLLEAVGDLKQPKKLPTYSSGINGLRAYFSARTLTDPRAKDRLFRVRIGFLINCKGEAGQWQLINNNRGELNEFANMVLDIVKKMPNKWTPATDRKGNPVDCWQILEFTISNGSLTNANYK